MLGVRHPGFKDESGCLVGNRMMRGSKINYYFTVICSSLLFLFYVQGPNCLFSLSVFLTI